MIFDNTQKAYHLKSDKELCKAYYLFRLISQQSLVSIGSYFAKIALKLKLPVAPIFKATVFSQFCAGIDKEEALVLVKKLEDSFVDKLKPVMGDVNSKMELKLKAMRDDMLS